MNYPWLVIIYVADSYAYDSVPGDYPGDVPDSGCSDCQYRYIIPGRGLVIMSLSVAGNRRLLEEDHVGDALKDAKEGLTDFAESFWGGSCLSQDQCTAYVATCGGQGRCTVPSQKTVFMQDDFSPMF